MVPIINGREVISQAKSGMSKTSVWLLGITGSEFVSFLCLICLVDGNYVLYVLYVKSTSFDGKYIPENSTSICADLDLEFDNNQIEPQ